MTDMISRDRAVAHITSLADEIAAELPAADYADGFVAGYRAAAKALSFMLSDHDAAIIASIKEEQANA